MTKRSLFLGAAFAAAGLFALSRCDQPEEQSTPQRALSDNSYILTGQARLRSTPYPGSADNTLVLLDEGSCVRPYSDGHTDREFLEVQVDTATGSYSGWVTKYVLANPAAPQTNCRATTIDSFTVPPAP